MSQVVPSSFDPFATHPFTNNSGIPPPQAQPYPYPRPIPSSQLHNPQAYPASMQSTSLPTAQTPLRAPQPQRAIPGTSNAAPSRQHVFETFKLERSSPDLKDVLKNSPDKAKSDAKRKAK